MSVRIMSQVWGLDLPDSEMLIMLALADWSNDEGGCWPSIAQLVKKTRKSERTIQGALKSMETAGHLTRHQRPGKGCVYTLHPRSDCTPAAAAPRRDRAPQPSRPAAIAPPQPLPVTPAAAAGNTSGHTTSSSDASHPTKMEGAAEPILLPDHVLEAWNEMAGRLSLPKSKMTDKRRARLRVLIRHHPIADFTEAIRCVERNRWMHGENERGWRADFDFLLQDKSFVKLVEGSYDRAQ